MLLHVVQDYQVKYWHEFHHALEAQLS